MKCPECGQEMEDGYVQASRQGLLTWKQVIVFINGSEENLDELLFFAPSLKGWRCQSCHLVVARKE
jgi:hypothetical protein